MTELGYFLKLAYVVVTSTPFIAGFVLGALTLLGVLIVWVMVTGG
ncbi:hypothetical protein LCGC14_1213270 [marine sediment metagenome]|uniref:Uncharacterized protein n=1 Tax=marine sediment metagenome TaxID=412755 RepID=A0A0F9LHN0_9ZZZZ